MNKNLKKPLLIGSLLILGLGATATLAQINVKSDLSNAVQNIQQVYFSPEGIRDPDPAKNILVELKNGVLTIHGKVINELPNAGNSMVPSAENSSLIQGKENNLFGRDSLMLGGFYNVVSGSSEGGIIAGGVENQLLDGSQNGIILGGQYNIIKNGSNSVIAAGLRNEIEGNNSTILGGELITIKGNNSVAIGKNIKADSTARNGVFLWSDNNPNWRLMGGETFFTPAKDNTFLIRAANGIGIGTADPKVKGIDVNGLIQIGDQPGLACSTDTKGAIKFQDESRCFCSCNGTQWVTMSPSGKCMQECNK